MKGLKYYAFGLCAALMLNSCGMSNTAKGGLLGGVGGGAVGAGAGAIIGNKMDKAKKAAQQVENADLPSDTKLSGRFTSLN